jgi:HSP20 family protein
MADKTKEVQKTEKQPVQAERVSDRPAFVPTVDIYETDEGGVLVADLPGCDTASVDIHLEDGVLTIKGRVDPPRFEGHEQTYTEYQAGDFERAFTVSELVDPEKIEASVKDGVLRVTLPKAEQAKPRKIQVKTG